MTRIKKDDWEYCVKSNHCLDCHAEGKTEEAREFQQRRRLKVPCCRKHFNEYGSKMSQLNHRKYKRRCQTKQKLGLCVCSGCHNRLIPRELQPRSWKSERSCGQHGTFKASRVNRIAMSKLISVNCLTAEEREGMKLRNIIYKPLEQIALAGVQYPGSYQTQVWSASELQRQYNEIYPK